MKTSSHSLSDLLMTFRRKLNESAKDHLLHQEISASQLEVLWLIAGSGKKSMESIATHLNIKPPSATALIEKMESKGMVQREKDANDRRIVYIDVSPKTKKELKAFAKHKEIIIEKLLSTLSVKDRKELERIIGLIIEKK